MVSFWDGAVFLGQVPLSTNGIATVGTSAPGLGRHAFQAVYNSDTTFASSTGYLAGFAPLVLMAVYPEDGALQLSFTNLSGARFTVLTASQVDSPLSSWTELGTAFETAPGQFQFTTPYAVGSRPQFYRVRSP